MKKFSSLAAPCAALALALTAPAFGQHGPGAHGHGAHGAPTEGMHGGMKGGGLSSLSSVDGEVRKIDKDAGKVTLYHGELKQLGMPPMTMVFPVSDRALLDRVKAGDKVRFKVANPHGTMIVTDLQRAH